MARKYIRAFPKSHCFAIDKPATMTWEEFQELLQEECVKSLKPGEYGCRSDDEFLWFTGGRGSISCRGELATEDRQFFHCSLPVAIVALRIVGTRIRCECS